MMNETIELFDALPKLKTKKEKFYAATIALALSYGHIVIALIVWYQSNWYIALSALLLAFLVTGIISSKLLHIYVPQKQHELSYSSKELATWVIVFYRYEEREIKP